MEGSHTMQTMANPFRLDNRVVWLAGGAGYLGSAICRALAGQGAGLVITDVDGVRAERLAADLCAGGHAAQAAALDVGDEAAVVARADAIVAQHGRIDVMINATYGAAGKPMEALSLDDWQAATRVGLGAAFILAREAGRHMRQQRSGSIIQFSSMYGLVSPDPAIYPPPYTVNPVEYGVAKAGILQLVRYQAVMWGRDGIRVNAIAPGPFPNPEGQGGHAAFTASLARKTALGRIGRAEEITGAVIFLASDAATFVTGTCLVVDGGWTAW